MIVALDVDYGIAATTSALVAFHAWTDAAPARELVERIDGPPGEYRPGHFFERELPPLLAVLDAFGALDQIEAIVIDGYVWLGPERPGLGMHLHTARAVPVIGVAKNRFAGNTATEVIRGESDKPLYVTSTSEIAQTVAAEYVRSMHGPYRIPTLLKRVDSLARGR